MKKIGLAEVNNVWLSYNVGMLWMQLYSTAAKLNLGRIQDFQLKYLRLFSNATFYISKPNTRYIKKTGTILPFFKDVAYFTIIDFIMASKSIA